MPVQNFTDRGVRALPIPTSGQVDYFDAGRKPAGFGVRISYKGTRAWIFIYRRLKPDRSRRSRSSTAPRPSTNATS